jgi:hypothetical protein
LHTYCITEVRPEIVFPYFFNHLHYLAGGSSFDITTHTQERRVYGSPSLGSDKSDVRGETIIPLYAAQGREKFPLQRVVRVERLPFGVTEGQIQFPRRGVGRFVLLQFQNKGGVQIDLPPSSFGFWVYKLPLQSDRLT